jgi:hypothetical protein
MKGNTANESDEIPSLHGAFPVGRGRQSTTSLMEPGDLVRPRLLPIYNFQVMGEPLIEAHPISARLSKRQRANRL